MKNNRLFRLLYLLLEQRSVAAPELARLLEVSVRTVYRDVEALCAAGIPLLATPGKGGGISLMPGYVFDRALLSDREQNQILFAIQALGALDQNVEGLLGKLGATFHKANANWIEVDFSRWGFHRADNERFALLKEAILEKRMLRLTYCGASSGMSERLVKPARLCFKDKCWYLQAFCLQAQDFRLFKLSRIVGLTPLDHLFCDSFAELPLLEAEGSPGFPLLSLRLRISPALAFRAYDEFESERIEPQADGSLVVEADLPPDGGLLSYLFSFGTELTVLAPVELKAQLAEYAEKIARHYQS